MTAPGRCSLGRCLGATPTSSSPTFLTSVSRDHSPRFSAARAVRPSLSTRAHGPAPLARLPIMAVSTAMGAVWRGQASALTTCSHAASVSQSPPPPSNPTSNSALSSVAPSTTRMAPLGIASTRRIPTATVRALALLSNSNSPALLVPCGGMFGSIPGVPVPHSRLTNRTACGRTGLITLTPSFKVHVPASRRPSSHHNHRIWLAPKPLQIRTRNHNRRCCRLFVQTPTTTYRQSGQFRFEHSTCSNRTAAP